MSSKTIQENLIFLRNKMHDMLQTLTPEHRDLFRRMYNHEGKHDRDVDGVKESQIDWAFQQIERTIYDRIQK